ncbi:MAG: hypothetical protein EOO88_41580 [Pedobacter sp.]|nr:MAG: hypothetical protein EOO88_41580 [Pedobacter sp.]
MKGTTLGTLKVGQKFIFGGVLFKVRSFNGDRTVDCSIGNTRNTVVIMGYSWVYVYRNRFRAFLDWL